MRREAGKADRPGQRPRLLFGGPPAGTVAHDQQAARPGEEAERGDQRADILLRDDPADVADPGPSQVRRRVGRVRGEQVRVIPDGITRILLSGILSCSRPAR